MATDFDFFGPRAHTQASGLTPVEPGENDALIPLPEHLKKRIPRNKPGAGVEGGRDALNSFVRSRFGSAWGAEALDVDALRDWRQIADVIEALKAMCRRAGIPTTRPEDGKC